MKAPFPWFGGKSRVAHIVWERFGDTPNYVEPFFGSGAVLLARPHEPRVETVNDKDCFLSNFWRAITNDPEGVAHWADYPVNEADLHARHLWLVNRHEFIERMKTDPDHFDSKIAGWWVWGISQWIGGGWCARPEWTGQAKPRRKRAILKRSGVGVHRNKLVKLRRGGNFAAIRQRPSRRIPDLGGEGSSGRGVHAPSLSDIDPLLEYFAALAERLRRVRVCCGDWHRLMGPSPTFHIGVTAVFLDPPYSRDAGRDPKIYAEEDLDVAHDVRDWAIKNGDNEKLRIALCGYEGEHQMPPNWDVVEWKANGGYSNRRSGPGRNNPHRERIWFSPHCLKPAQYQQGELAIHNEQQDSA